MINNPLVSVIIPVYNVEKFLPDCLKSVCAQSYENLEIICVNDGSPDKCGDILLKFANKDKRIVVIDKENGGQASARNIGIKKAKGEFLFFLDSDDWIDKKCIESLVETQLRTHADVVCIHDIVIYYSPKKTQNERMISGHSEGTFQVTNEIINQMWVVPWGKLFKRQQILDLDISFPEGCIYEDEYFHFALMANLHKIAVSDGGKVFYRQRENSTMSSKKLRSGKDNLLIFQKIFEYYQENGFLGKIDLPVRILSSGFAQNANPKLYYQQVKDLLCHLGVTKDMVNHHQLVGKLLESEDFAGYCRYETFYHVKQGLKKWRKNIIRLKLGKKTHIALFGLTLFHLAKGEKTVILGWKL